LQLLATLKTKAVRPLSCLILAGLIVVMADCSRPGLKPEVFIPDGVPVTLDVSRDDHDSGLITYNVRATLAADAEIVTMFITTVGADNRFRPEADDAAEATLSRDEDHTSYGWPMGEDIRRLIVIVERVETASGVWRLDGDLPRDTLLRAVVEHGRDALPKAKFIRRD
jgi:hypothetical protein